MRPALRRIVPTLACTTLAACFALPASLSFARHRQLKGGTRRLACESFVPSAPMRVAKAGDTLWDLTGDNTGKPWIWPQIWTLNPEITNPHVLAVGQQIYFVARADAPAPKIASDMPTVPQLDAAAAWAPDAPPVPASPALAANVVVVATDAPAPSVPAPSCLPAAFFAASELRSFGTVTRSTHAGLLGGVGDQLAIRWPSGTAAPQGPWALVQILAHSGGRQGQVASCTGIAQPLGGSGGAVGVVISAREEIEMGQRVLPLSALRAPEDDLSGARGAQIFGPQDCGRVLAFEEASLTGSPMHLVFFDRGRADGLSVGDRLTGPGDGLGRRAPASCIVLRVGEHSATLKPLRAGQELSRGDALCGIHPAPPAR